MAVGNKKPIPLFWWSEIKFIFREKENYGDLLSKYLAEKISRRPVKWVHPKKQPWYKLDKTTYLAIGSILTHATRHSIVWGSGIIDRKLPVAPAEFRAVRGPHTRNFLLEQHFECPEIYGDPALLLPCLYAPKVEKEYQLGVIPHYRDHALALELLGKQKGIRIIDLLTNDVEAVTREILSCERIISSSLHGLIVAHAYGIPGLWVEFSNWIFGDGVKYSDYLESVGLPLYAPPFIACSRSVEELRELFQDQPVLPEKETIRKIQDDLLRVCPF